MNASQRQLCMVGRIADLPQIIDFIEASAEEFGVVPAARFDLQLAAEEACTNVIEHAYAGRGGYLEVCLEARDADVVITIRDHGPPFEPDRGLRSDLDRPLDQRKIGGLGLHLMEKLMDEVRFTYGPDGNLLVMVKHAVILPAGWADAA